MTFAIVTANADQVIQVSDRRLTLQGQLFKDSLNKAGHAVCDDASFLYCFTGLAYVDGDYTTSPWLLDVLYDAAQWSHKYRDIWDALAEEATNFFRSSVYLQNLPADQRRLTVMITGYTSDDYIVNAGMETAEWRLPVRRSESPTGYSSAGCSPAEPASASPVTDHRSSIPMRCLVAIQCRAGRIRPQRGVISTLRAG